MALDRSNEPQQERVNQPAQAKISVKKDVEDFADESMHHVESTSSISFSLPLVTAKMPPQSSPATQKSDVLHWQMGAQSSGESLSIDEFQDKSTKDFRPASGAEVRLRRKIDLHVMPVVFVMYTFCFIDRSA